MGCGVGMHTAPLACRWLFDDHCLLFCVVGETATDAVLVVVATAGSDTTSSTTMRDIADVSVPSSIAAYLRAVCGSRGVAEAATYVSLEEVLVWQRECEAEDVTAATASVVSDMQERMRELEAALEASRQSCSELSESVREKEGALASTTCALVEVRCCSSVAV